MGYRVLRAAKGERDFLIEEFFYWACWRGKDGFFRGADIFLMGGME
jgi:hypothetical protein